MTILFRDKPEDWQLRWRARAYEANGDVKAAHGDYMRLAARASARLRDDPTRWHHWYERGLARAAAGRREAALGDLTRAIELKPDIFGPRIERAEVLIRLERYSDALDDIDTAKELNWSDPIPAFDLLRAECYLGLDNAAAARACLLSMPDALDPEPAALRQELLARCELIDVEKAPGTDGPR